MYLVRCDNPRQLNNAYQHAARIAASILVNRKIYNEKVDPPIDIPVIKSWDELDPFNVYTDDDGVYHKLLTRYVQVCTVRPPGQDHNTADIERIVSNTSYIFGSIGLPIPYLLESEHFISTMAIAEVNEHGLYSTGTGAKCKNQPVVKNGSGGENSIFDIDAISIQDAHDLCESVSMTDDKNPLTIIIMDFSNTFKGATYDIIDITDITTFVVYDTIATAHKHPLRSKRIYDFRFVKTDIVEDDDRIIPFTQQLTCRAWSSIKPYPVAPHYESINAVLKNNKAVDIHIGELLEMTDDRKTDICFKCKTPLFDDIYVIESAAGYHICVCGLCGHTSDLFDIIGEGIKYTVSRVKFPRKMSAVIDSLENSKFYNEVMKLIYLGYSDEEVEEKLDIVLMSYRSNFSTLQLMRIDKLKQVVII